MADNGFDLTGGHDTSGSLRINPFENAFSIMKELQMEVRQLQAELRDEKFKNAQEVGELREQIKDLTEELAKERAERLASAQEISSNLQEEVTQRKSDMDEEKARRRMELAKVANELEIEMKERRSEQQKIKALIEDNTDDTKDEREALKDGINMLDKREERNNENLKHALEHVTSDVQSIASHLHGLTRKHGEFDFGRLHVMSYDPSSPSH